MAKFLKRLEARLGREALRESKTWIVSKKLILETDEGDLALDIGDVVEVGATPEGDMALKGQAAVVVISDAELASRIADIVVSSDELSDVNFVQKPALDAVMGGEDVGAVVDKLADMGGEEDTVEIGEIDIDKKESVQSKFAKFSKTRMNPAKALVCEAIQIAEGDESALNIAIIKTDVVAKENFEDNAKFMTRVSELGGSVQPGAIEVALNETGKVIGSFDKETNLGMIYPETVFESVEEMTGFESRHVLLVKPVDFGAELTEAQLEEVEASLKTFEESTKTGKDYVTMVEALIGEKVGLTEAATAKVVGTFDSRNLQECVRVYDSKFGKYVAAFKESVEADNFIIETEVEKRFTKRFFN